MAADQDSEIVHANFRRVARSGFWMAAGLNMLHAVVFLIIQHPLWQWSVGLALVWSSLTRFLVVGSSLRVFLVAMLGGMASMVTYASILTLIFGRAGLFHALLMAMLLLVAVNGHIGLRSKWMIAVALGIYIVTLDTLSARPISPVPDAAAEVLRAINLAMLVPVLTGLMHRYFALAVRQQAQLQIQAMTDELTGLMNRRQVMLSGKLFIKQCRRRAQPLSVILCDLDHFKSVNDRFGHDAGDTVLKFAADVFRRGVRETDAACRWGGEEFLLVLPGADLQGALALADRIRLDLSASPVAIGQECLYVTVTMGVASLGIDETLEAAIERADQALYLGKEAGRNRAFSMPPFV